MRLRRRRRRQAPWPVPALSHRTRKDGAPRGELSYTHREGRATAMISGCCHAGQKACATRQKPEKDGAPRLAPDGNPCKPDTSGLLQRAYVVAGEIRYVGKETDRKWEEGDDIRLLEFASTEYGRSARVIASDEVKKKIFTIGINKCARESGFDRKNFIRKLVRGVRVKRNSYEDFLRWLRRYK